MTTDQMKRFFNFYEEQYPRIIKFEEIEAKLSNRRDLHGLRLLDLLMPGKDNLISGAEHDEIFFHVDMEKLAEIITESQIQELVACGIYYSDEYDCLRKNV